LLAWILYAVIRRSPRRWWLYFWIISLPLLLFGIFISPYVIDPLFNKYEPLSTKAPQLVPELQRVTRRAGQEIAPERMFWMKASDKTIATNASVNGFGASKRIIIWDTLSPRKPPMKCSRILATKWVTTSWSHLEGVSILRRNNFRSSLPRLPLHRLASRAFRSHLGRPLTR